MDLGFRLHAERTPNPDSIKWVVGQQLVEDRATAHFTECPGDDVSPLASRLFDIEGVVGVFFAANFATVTKREDVEWTDIAQPIVDAIKECVGSGGSVLGPAFEPVDAAAEGEVVARIRQILDEEIRPAVAMDGGDIVFDKFEAGIVYLQLKGSCSGCPSSMATLKQGVETRLRQLVPEVLEVQAVAV